MGEVITINDASYSGRDLDLIRETVAKGTNNAEFELFIQMCKEKKLSPVKRQIYPIIFNADKPEKRQLTIVTGIDGYRAIADRTGEYMPDENPAVILYDDNAVSDTNPKGIVCATVTIKKWRKDGWHPVRAIAYWDEYVPVREKWETNELTGKKEPMGNYWPLDKTSFWYKMPHVMISKCAEALAIRKAFPEAVAGVLTEEEMEQAKSREARDITPSEMAEEARELARLEKTQTKNAFMVQWEISEGVVAVPHGEMADRCIEYITNTAQHSEQLKSWSVRNRITLQDFWARSPSDALAVKKVLEERLDKLLAEEK